MRMLEGRWPLPAALAVLVAAAGAVGYLDWRGHRPAEEPGRTAHLCGVPTGSGSPLGRLLPPGGQDVEERQDGRSGDPVSCTIRVDGRTALTVLATHHDGQPALPPEAAQHPDAHGFAQPGPSASWAGSAVIARTCPPTKSDYGYVVLEVTAGAAARTGDSSRSDLEQIATAVVQQKTKDACQ
ncbi:hypothetical protein ACIRVF_31010 [Kitasatospora sp. NPDC101157]|uniref:hypothetical protein n=1 Tax=Kitasatospora sp. NPDC101157 TaxID=3364098 RepID=UPI00380FA876